MVSHPLGHGDLHHFFLGNTRLVHLKNPKTMSRLALGRTTSRPGSHHASNGFLPIYAYPASWNPEVPLPTTRGVGVPSLALQPAWKTRRRFRSCLRTPSRGTSHVPVTPKTAS